MHERASAAQGGDACLYRLVKRLQDRTPFAGPSREGEGCLLSVRIPAVRHLRRLDAGGERIRSEPTVLTVSPSALTGVGRAAQPTRSRQGDVSSFQAELLAFRVGEDDPAHAGRLALWAPRRTGRQFSLLVVARRDQVQVDPVLGLLRLDMWRWSAQHG